MSLGQTSAEETISASTLTLVKREEATAKPWSLFSRYGHVLICLAENPDIRVSDLAERIGVTERSARGLVDTLEKNQVVITTRVGRNNRYEIDQRVKLAHSLESYVDLGNFLKFARSARDAGLLDEVTH